MLYNITYSKFAKNLDKTLKKIVICVICTIIVHSVKNIIEFNENQLKSEFVQISMFH